jgi:hypothetical protein
MPPINASDGGIGEIAGGQRMAETMDDSAVGPLFEVDHLYSGQGAFVGGLTAAPRVKDRPVEDN